MSATSPAPAPAFLYGTAWKEERTALLTELAIRMGFRAVDTANQRKHYFESGVGEGIAAALAKSHLDRGELFIQTKFTSRDGQDDRLPYDPAASLPVQVAQSLTSSLEHLRVDYVDSFVLHGPSLGNAWSDDDTEIWHAMTRERDAGRTRLVGVSNVALLHLEAMAAAGLELPAIVQNRCYARFGWDRAVRHFCDARKIVYQGFSLLTANRAVLRFPLVTDIAARQSATPAQVVFRFASAIGMLPMTGTSAADHMAQDLASLQIPLSPDEVRAIESLAGAA